MSNLSIWLLLMASSIILGNAEVHIVLMHGEPVVHYKGAIAGYSPTAAAPGARVDTSSPHVQAYASYLIQQHDALLDATFDRGSYKKLYSYSHLVHGFAAEITKEQATKLRSVQGVKLVSKDGLMRKMTTHTPTLLGLEAQAWPELGGTKNAGEGIVIGVVDTGINPVHPSFADDHTNPYAPIAHFHGKCQPANLCNSKLVGAQFFAKAAISQGLSQNSTHMASVYDMEGHGSHVASTAAGNHGVPVIVNGLNYGNASGIAPRARIAAYKAIFGDLGFISDIIAAIEQAVQDYVDIISLSLGPAEIPDDPCLFLNPFELALLSAVEYGIFVVQSGGNSGPKSGTMSSFSPWVFTVAASNTGRGYSGSIELGNGKTLNGVGLSSSTLHDTKYPLVLASDAFIGTEYSEASCNISSEFNVSLVIGRIFVCQYSTLDGIIVPHVLGVAKAAKHLRAAGFVMLLDPKSPYSNYMTDLYPLPMPGIIINDANISLEFHKYYDSSLRRDSAGQVTEFGALARINDGNAALFNKTVPIVMMPFSSRGPNFLNKKRKPVDVLKPNILAPGSSIWAAWTPSATDIPWKGQHFAMISGTSMAAPHVAGIAALVKQKYPNWSPAAISSALMTTASITDSKGQPITAVAESGLSPGTPFHYGAGFVNVSAALDPGLIFDAGYQDYVNFLCSLDIENITQQVENATTFQCSSPLDAPYNLNSPSITVASLKQPVIVRRNVTSVIDVNETYTAALLQPPHVFVTITPNSFTLEPRGTASFEVHLTLAKDFLKDYVFGVLLLAGDKGHNARIPITVASQ